MSRRLLIVWALVAVLVAAIVYAQRVDLMSAWQKTDDGHAHSGPRDLVTVPLDALSAVEIVSRGTVHRFERDASSAWFYHGAHGAQQAAHEHQTDAAAAERIDKALTAFTRTRIERRFTLDFAALGRSQDERDLSMDDSVRDYGVTVPSMLVLLYQPGQVEPLARYAVGDVAPDTYSRYIQRLGSQEVVTIANYQIQNLEQLLAALTTPAAQPAAAPVPDAAARQN
jgi:hypothetical protein